MPPKNTHLMVYVHRSLDSCHNKLNDRKSFPFWKVFSLFCFYRLNVSDESKKKLIFTRNPGVLKKQLNDLKQKNSNRTFRNSVIENHQFPIKKRCLKLVHLWVVYKFKTICECRECFDVKMVTTAATATMLEHQSKHSETAADELWSVIIHWYILFNNKTFHFHCYFCWCQAEFRIWKKKWFEFPWIEMFLSNFLLSPTI